MISLCMILIFGSLTGAMQGNNSTSEGKMSQAIETLKEAQQYAMTIRPKVGGFPYLAEVLRAAGVTKNVWILPACQCIYWTKQGNVASQSTPLITDMADVARFNREALIRALQANQAGQSTFPQFLESAWKAGVVRYEVDFIKRNVTYYGCLGEEYKEEYPAVVIKK